MNGYTEIYGVRKNYIRKAYMFHINVYARKHAWQMVQMAQYRLH